jgi:predicted SAM-dependent methyltransferase
MKKHTRSGKEILTKSIKHALDKAGLQITKKTASDDLELYPKLFPQESLTHRRFYTVSAGGHRGFGTDFEHPYWTNIDLLRPIPAHHRQFNPETDVCHDLIEAKPLPIENNSAEIILSQYSVEHVPDSAAAFFFTDALRALKPGGILKVVTPNTELDVLAYLNNDRSFYWWLDWLNTKEGFRHSMENASLEQAFVSHFAANASSDHIGGNPNQIDDNEVREVMHNMKMEDALDYITAKCCPLIQRQYRDNHMSWWSPTKLVRELEKAGFSKTTILAPCQSGSPILRNPTHFDKLFNNVATFVEAVK